MMERKNKMLDIILDIIENICIMIGILALFIFGLGAIGILMLCVLFRNIIGFIFIGILIAALLIYFYIYFKECTKNSPNL